MIVLTQNIWGGAPFWGRRRRALSRLIAALRPDIVGLQEVHAPGPSGSASQAHDLAIGLGDYRATFAPGRVARSGRAEGLAILSRWPIQETTTVSLSMDRGDGLDRFGRRIVLRALIALPDGAVDVFVTHLSISGRARKRTLAEVLDFTARTRSASPTRSALLLGDLNAGPGEPIIEALTRAGWVDVWTATHSPNDRGGTWPACAPWRRIDYIFVQNGGHLLIQDGRLAPRAGSDHLGVVAVLGPLGRD